MNNQPQDYFKSAYLRIWWFPLVTGVIIVLGSLLLLIPQVSQVISTYQDWQSSNQELQQAQAKIDQVAQLNTDDLSHQTQLINNALPPHKPYFEAMTTLQQLAANTQLTLADVDLSGTGSLSTSAATLEKAGNQKLSTTISVSGTADQITQFVQGLQQSLPIISVTSIGISKGDVNNQERQAQIGIDIAYMVNPPVKITTSFDPLPKFTDDEQTTLNSLESYTAAQATASAVFNLSRQDIFSY